VLAVKTVPGGDKHPIDVFLRAQFVVVGVTADFCAGDVFQFRDGIFVGVCRGSNFQRGIRVVLDEVF
jgi:hypothetical protein